MKNLLFNPSQLFIISILLIALPLRTVAQRDSSAAVHFGFIYPISSNGKQAASITNRFSLHVIAGLSKAETGAAIAGVANVVKQDAAGVDMAGAVNVIGGAASGAQLAGVANIIGGAASGVQMAGGANVIGGNAGGAQLAGFANITGAKANGAQVAGFMNLAETAGAAQIAGFTNIARKDARGLQLAGFLNRAEETNTQIAGFANVAKKVKGVQLAGLINIADSSDYPIALFNFIKTGEKSVALTVDETLTSILSFRSGGRVLYGIAGIGYNIKNNADAVFAAEGGFGAHVPVAGNFRLNLEAVGQVLTDFNGGAYSKNSLRVLPALKFGDHFEAFAGPTINYVSYDRDKDFDYIKKFLWKKDRSEDFQGLFVGFNAGVQFVF